MCLSRSNSRNLHTWLVIHSSAFDFFFVAFIIVKAAEAVFVQYVSQNVNYTSAIILKRILKSKIELSIGTVILIFFPVMYTLFRSLMSEYTLLNMI